jgi:acyl-CoA reductase-like NAD-dependent aldehyde dehydrogenase
VDSGVERAAVIASLLKGGFYHSGQVCVSVQRVFVPAAELKDFANDLGRAAEKLVVGDPADAETQCGPLIRTEEVDRVERWVDEAIAAGGTLVCGGSRLSDTLFSPTVIVDPPESAKVSQEEIFGPVICVYGYDDIDLAIEQANALPYAFQAAVFSDRLSIANHCIRSLTGSAVMVNDHTAFRVDWMPFAGLRRSGLGVGGIAYTMEDMSIEKMAVWNWPTAAS